jgi:hypothetical protein
MDISAGALLIAAATGGRDGAGCAQRFGVVPAEAESDARAAQRPASGQASAGKEFAERRAGVWRARR